MSNAPAPPASPSPFEIKKAVRQNCKVKMALSGPSGSGKTYTALALGTRLSGSKATLLFDSENDSSVKYAPTPDGKQAGFDFDHVPLKGDYHPKRIVQAIEHGVANGYGCLIFDSLTPFWNSTNGFLEQLDNWLKRNNSKDSHGAWKHITPMYRAVVEKIVQAPIHIICTLRAKQDYSKENGKVVKLGMAPEMRDGFEYEVDMHALLNTENELHFTKTRCSMVKDRVFQKPGQDLANILLDWANAGE